MSRSATQTRILVETCRLLRERPRRKVRVEDIAAAAGVSRQAVYLHFPSRTALLSSAAQLAEENARTPQQLERIRSARPGRQAIERYVSFQSAYVAQVFGVAEALAAEQEADAGAAAAWAERTSLIRGDCEAMLRRIEEQGRLRKGWTAAQAADVMTSLLSVPVWVSLVVDRGWPEADFVRRMQSVLRRTFLARRKKRARPRDGAL